MKSRGLILAVLTLAALFGLLLWSNRREAAAVGAGTPDAPRLLTLNQADITRIDIRRKGNAEVKLAKKDSGDWQVAEATPLPGDSNTMSTLLSSLASLSSDRLVEEKPADLGPYGLAQPAVEAEITTKDGKTNKLLFGDNTPTGASTFAMLAGDPRLFTVSSSVKTSLDKGPVDFANKKLFKFGFEFPDKVEMRLASKSYVLAHSGDDWLSNGAKMDATSMQSVIARIRDLEGTGFVDTGFGKPVVEFTVTPGGGKPVEKVALSRSGKNYVGKRENEPALYAVNASLIDDLEKFVGEIKPAAPPAPEASTPPSTPSAPAPTK